MQLCSTELLDQVRNTLHLKHYSLRTETAYVDWIRRYILFHHQRYPGEMSASEHDGHRLFLRAV